MSTLISCTRPAKSGCRYRYTDPGTVHYWVSCPKKAEPRAWARRVVCSGAGAVEVWDRVELSEAVDACRRFYAQDDRNPRFRALLNEVTRVG